MKITAVETLLMDRYVYVQVHTGAGITSGAAPLYEAGLPSPGRNAFTTSGFTSRRGPPSRSTQ